MGRVRSEPRPGWGQWHPRSPLLCLSAVSVPPHQHSDLFGWHKVFPRKPGHWEVQGRVSGPRPATRPPEPGAAAPRWVGSRQPVKSSQEAQDSHPPLHHRSRETLAQPALGLGRRTVGRERSPGLRSDWA